jgi:hypothetical protein
MTDISHCLARLGIGSDAPKTMGSLEAALGIELLQTDLAGNDLGLFHLERGLDGDVRSVFARYQWDMYHERPPTSVEGLRGRRLLELTLHMTRGRAEIVRTLYQRFGQHRLVNRAFVYERWFVNDGEDDGCSLSYHEKLPDSAVPAPDASGREQALLALVGAAASAATLDDVARTVASAPPSAGIVLTGTFRNNLNFEFVPPLAASELARILGWQNLVCESRDVHQSTWTITKIVSAASEETVTAPAYGRWKLRASLDGSPTGDKVPHPSGPPGGRYFLGASDVVRYFALGS